MRTGKGVLLDLDGRAALRATASKWADGVETTTARFDDRPANLDGMLIRPDGYVAWAIGSADVGVESERSLRRPLRNGLGVR